MSTTIKIRRDNAANWASNNPTLALGEFGVVTDTTPKRIKIGDGITAWNSLPFFTLPNASTSAAGLMSATDKDKLNGIETSAISLNSVIKALGITVGEALRFTYGIPSAGNYRLLTDETYLQLMSCNSVGYKTSTAAGLSAGNVTASFILKEAEVIPDGLCDSHAYIKSIHIPSWIRKIGSKAFANTGITAVNCECMTPPAVEADSFLNVNVASATLTVHKLALTLYQSDAFWSTFGTITTF